MYSTREKLKIHSELLNEEHAGADLDLLRIANPKHPLLERYSRNPDRYFEDILYALLDVATREQIRENRRAVSKEKEVTAESNAVMEATAEKEFVDETSEDAQIKDPVEEVAAEISEEQAPEEKPAVEKKSSVKATKKAKSSKKSRSTPK
jgi:outer membrane biosynthesis protein TonB